MASTPKFKERKNRIYNRTLKLPVPGYNRKMLSEG
jgi:hypothetical protein